MRWILVVVTLCAVVSDARGDGDLTEEESEIQIHGFVSQGALLTSDNNYLAKTERGSLEFTEAALTLSKQLDPRLRVGFQLFARDLGPVGNYSAKLDWFNLDYRWRDWLGIRAGRTKVPFGFYNEFGDFDPATGVILLPQSVYSITSRDFLLAQSGVELYGYRPIGDLGALEYRTYFGSININLADTADIEVIGFEVPWVTGGRVVWETPIEGLRVGGSVLAGEIRGDLRARAAPIAIDLDLDSTNFLASLEYSVDQLTFTAEYGRAYTKTTLTYEGQPPQVTDPTTQNGYLMASYRLTRWFQSSLYYSLKDLDANKRNVGAESRQHDAAMSFRFDITPNWLFKLEGHSMRGTASLDAALNPEGLSNRWYLAAAKTTVYF